MNSLLHIIHTSVKKYVSLVYSFLLRLCILSISLRYINHTVTLIYVEDTLYKGLWLDIHSLVIVNIYYYIPTVQNALGAYAF